MKISSVFRALRTQPQQRTQASTAAPVRLDVFVRHAVDAARAAVGRVEAAGAQELAGEVFARVMRRAPTAEESVQLSTLARTMAHQGSNRAAIERTLVDGLSAKPEAMLLGRIDQTIANDVGRTETEGPWHDLGRALLAQGKPVDEIVAAIDALLKASPEFRKLHAADNVNAAYAFGLGRAPTADELSGGETWVRQLIDEGKNNDEVNQALGYVMALSPEFQALHRLAMSTDRESIYLQQPNGWSCGPTSLAMALAAAGVRPASQATVQEMIAALGATAGVGTPGSAELIASTARSLGVNAEYNASREPNDVRAALERGHGAVVNGDIAAGGHFIYLAGLDANGQFIVFDPFRPGIQTWNDQDLYGFTHHGNNPPGFAEIWR